MPPPRPAHWTPHASHAPTHGGPPQPHSAYTPYGWHPGPTGPGTGTLAVATDEPVRRPSSILGPLAVATWLAALGVVTLLDRLGAIHLTPIRVLGLTVAVVGVALIVGTVFGRARGLIAVGIIGTLLLVPVAAASNLDLPLRGGVGERDHAPVTVEAVQDRYDLLAGRQVIDLTGLALDGEEVSFSIGQAAGELIIRVPDDISVHVHGRLQAGEVDVLDQARNGTGLVIDAGHEADPAAGSVDIQIDMLVGEITVERIARR